VLPPVETYVRELFAPEDDALVPVRDGLTIALRVAD
jgi:hypothetical protein